MVCAKSKRVPEGFRERNIHHDNAIKALLQTFGAAKHFFPKNLERESDSTKYTDIQSEYVGKLAKIKLLDTRIMAYNMRYPFLSPHFYISMPVQSRTVGGTVRRRGYTFCPTG